MDFEEKKIKGELVYDGKLLKVYRDEVLLPNGKTSYREYLLHHGASCILARLPNGKFIVEKQFRYPFHTVLYEFPAGKCDAGENPEQTAIRELEEETGYLAHKIKLIGKIYPTVAYSSEVIHLYYAEDLEKTKTHLDEGEFVEVVEMTFEEIMELLKNGEFNDGKSIACIAYYNAIKDSLAD